MSGRRGLILAFLAALALALGFAGHAVSVALREAGEPPRVEPWMTLGLVAETYGIAPQVLAGTLGIEAESARGQTLAEIAQDSGMPVADLLAQVQAAVDTAKGAP